MSTDPKIYTAAEVVSAGFSEEEINQALAEVTQKAYKASKEGGYRVTYYHANMNLLNGIASRLMELGYDTETYEKVLDGPYIIVRWDIN